MRPQFAFAVLHVLLILGASLASGHAHSSGPERDVVVTSGKWALLVGTEAYDDPTIIDLRFADDDAKAMGKTLIDSGDWAPDHVVVMTPDQDNPVLHPTNANIRAQLARLAQIEHADTVLFYFSGHGAAVGEGHDMVNLLFPQDARWDSPVDTALPLPWLLQRLRQIDAPRLYVVLDSCRSEIVEGTKAPAQAWDLDALVVPQGVQVLFSTRPGQKSCEDERVGLGSMTRYLVEGLQGDADGATGNAPDNWVDTGEVYARMVDRMSQTVTPCGVQVPTRAGEWDHEFNLLRTRRPPTADEPCAASNERLRLQIEIALDAYIRGDGDGFRRASTIAACRLRGLTERISKDNAANWHLLEAVRSLHY